MSRKKISRKDAIIIEAVRASAGNLSAAAKKLNISRSTLYNRMKESPALAEAVHDLQEGVVDLAETIMQSHLRDQDMTAAMYVLNNFPAAKRRGYGPRTEVTGADGAAILIKMDR